MAGVVAAGAAAAGAALPLFMRSGLPLVVVTGCAAATGLRYNCFAGQRDGQTAVIRRIAETVLSASSSTMR